MVSRRVRLDVGEPFGFVNEGVIELRQFIDAEMKRLTKACGFDIEPWESGLWSMTRRLVADTLAEAVQPPSRRVAKDLNAIDNDIAALSRRLSSVDNIRDHIDWPKPTSPDPAFHAVMLLRQSIHFEAAERELVALRKEIAKVVGGLEGQTVGRKAATKLPVEHMRHWLPVLTWGGAPLTLPSKPVFDQRYPLADFGIEMLRIAAERFSETASEHKLPVRRPILADALGVAVSSEGAPTWAYIQALTRIRKAYRQRER